MVPIESYAPLAQEGNGAWILREVAKALGLAPETVDARPSKPISPAPFVVRFNTRLGHSFGS